MEQSEMVSAFWHPNRSRGIVKRLIITGDLVLQTAASFSNGDQDDLVDIALLRDALQPNRPLLTGASLAGALRSYLAAHEPHRKHNRLRHAELLFGGAHSDPNGEQSPLIVHDTLGVDAAIELRDGVRINAKSRTAEHGALYNRTMWAAGTRFPLKMELVVSEASARAVGFTLLDYEAGLKSALAAALKGLEEEQITLGGRKTRGCGRARVECWRVVTYDMSCIEDLQAWVLGTLPETLPAASKIEALLGTALNHAGSFFELKATFVLDGSLLVRTEGGGVNQPDMVHQRVRQHTGETKAILAGTSLAGALRARAGKILRTLAQRWTACEPERILEEVFGTDMARRDGARSEGHRTELPHASRLRVSEQTICGGEQDLVQPRVSIDRFTGGAIETALFSEQPIFGNGNDVRTEVTLRIKKPEEAHIGLLLLTIKDLWTHDLPIGGESSVGRGRWCGEEATLTYQVPGTFHQPVPHPRVWKIQRASSDHTGKLRLPADAADLEKFVQSLHHRIATGNNASLKFGDQIAPTTSDLNGDEEVRS